MYARTTLAVASGRSVTSVSSRSANEYISFSTTSVVAPRERANNSERSRTGRRISPKLCRVKVAAARSSMDFHRWLSSGRTSRNPFTTGITVGFAMWLVAATCTKRAGYPQREKIDTRGLCAHNGVRREECRGTDPRRRPTMLATDTLTTLFHDLVRSAMATQQVESSETTEHYLVSLLEAFVRPSQRDLLDPPLGVDYLTALHLPAAQRYDKLKRVADTALFITGVFVDSLERSLVGPDYYAAIGRNAYAGLSALPRRTGLAELFGELATRFPEFARVLMEISAQELFRRQEDTLRLYKRWEHTRGQREADLLVRRGIIPFAPSTSRRH